MADLITNHEQKLGDEICKILPSTDKLFVLVGYFYYSGFSEISDEIIDKEIKILVGLDIEKNILNKFREFELVENIEKSKSQIRREYNENFVKFFNDSDFFDSEDKQRSFKLFIEKIKNGSLEIRKTLKPNHSKLYLFQAIPEHNQGGSFPGTMITGSSNLTRSGLYGQGEINTIFRDKTYNQGKKLFDELWETGIDIVSKNNLADFLESVVEKIWFEKLPKPFIMYVRVLDEYFSLKKDNNIKLPSQITDEAYFDLEYQTDALHRGLDIIKKHNGVIISDVVGLGKSIIASAIAYNLRRKAVIIAPPHLVEQWNDYWYEFDFRAKVYSSGKIEDALKDNDFTEEKLIIIDEAHKYRNEMTRDYGMLHQLCQGNKVILLTATPFNNRPQDIFSMIKLFQLPSKTTIQTVDNLALQFKSLIIEYKNIQKKQKDSSINEVELKRRINELSDKIRDILSPVLIRRSRIDLEKIEKYRLDLDHQNISYSQVHDPIVQEYNLGSLSELYLKTLKIISTEDKGKGLEGARYKPVSYLKDYDKYKEKITKEFGDINLFRKSQMNIAKFMKHLLVRRFESSFQAFMNSLENMIKSFELILDWHDRLHKVPIYKKGKLPDVDSLMDDMGDDISEELFNFTFEGQLQKYYEKGLMIIEANEIKVSFARDLRSDIDLLKSIQEEWKKVKTDPKLDHFKEIIKNQLASEPNRKIVIFTEFNDTAQYLYKSLKDEFRIFKYSGSEASKNNKEIIKENFDASYKNAQKNDFDILVATDSISEGYNLHRAGTIFNYDIPYNPTRVIQRVGRINRIDKKVFEKLYIYNYFPTDIGAQHVRTKQISTLKLAVIQAILGSDTKILTPDETLESFYAKQYEKEFANQEQVSWDAEYLDFYNKLKLTNPEVIEKSKEIPHRTRIRRSASKSSGVIVFGSKGDEYTFKFSSDGKEVVSLSVKDAFQLFEAEVEESSLSVTNNFDNIYQKIKEKLFIKKSELASDKGRRQAIDKLKVIKSMLNEDKDYLDDLLVVLESLDGLPDRFAKLIRAFDKKTLKDDIEEFKEEVPHQYLERIIKKSTSVNDGKERLILAEEF